MTGADTLLQMRRAQRWPEAVWIVDGDCAIDARDWQQHPNCKTGALHAEIEVAATDVPEVLDLRCCIGLTCHITALRGEARARRLHQCLIDARAQRVATAIHHPGGVELLLHGVPSV